MNLVTLKKTIFLLVILFSSSCQLDVFDPYKPCTDAKETKEKCGTDTTSENCKKAIQKLETKLCRSEPKTGIEFIE